MSNSLKIKFVSDLWQVVGFLQIWYRWNIVKSGVSHHNHNPFRRWKQQTVENLIHVYNTGEQSNIYIPQNNDGYSTLMLLFRAMHIYYSWYKYKTPMRTDVHIVSHVIYRNTRCLSTKRHYETWQINVKLLKSTIWTHDFVP